MSATLRPQLPQDLTVAEFLEWADATPGRWQLRDGQPESMPPPAETHAAIQSYLGYLLTSHLERAGGRCRVLTGPGVVPRLQSQSNMLVPDLAITCAPPSAGRAAPEPLVLIEILSPSNFRRTRENIWAFATIPSVHELLVVDSRKVAAEVMQRQADGSWPERGEPLGADDTLRLETIVFEVPLRAVYRTTVLA